ncbi:hypothetical protein [Aquariibacter albus]|uniref:Lipoprotein n=1 Tax=Aquariibacter albus TaxID=2759899 RepID=A0A839HSP9_9BURK|nr:hypothetical protein [Aquariibacter albus]MBB1160874.1 hypothetical protein [Aquariibacter albus]
MNLKPHSRALGTALILSTAVLLGGCMTKPVQPLSADGTYCYRAGKMAKFKTACTGQAAPSEQAQADAQRFEADPEALTVYVMRKRWVDGTIVVPLSVDGSTSIDTVPESWLRLKLPAQQPHRLTARWNDQSVDLVVDGKPGEVRFVELAGSHFAWGTDFRLNATTPAAAIPKAQASRLVADLDLRR